MTIRLPTRRRSADELKDAYAGLQEGCTPRPVPGCYRMRQLPTADEQLLDEQEDDER